ncbi:MAG TPA: hypothetical protein IAD11_10295 [Candidatus Stercorousia faecigallinarum]|nr:hypothetical protein [Candidatus Stercorousia faecigallinarum]
MKYYGTKNNKDYGFYLENFDNAIELSDEYWSELLEAQNSGKIIILFENSVIAVNENEYSFENGKWKKLSDKEAGIKQLKIQNAIRESEILAELEELDKKRIRAIAEPSMKDEEQTWLEYYNLQISGLRNELAEIT